MESTRSTYVAPCDTSSSSKRKQETLCPADIFKRFGDAAVTLRTIPKFRVFWQNFNNTTNCLNPGSHYNAGVVPVSTSGFFIQKGFIVSGIPCMTILLLAALFFTYVAAMCWVPGMTTEQLQAAVNNCTGCQTPTNSKLTNEYHEIPGFLELMRGICSGASFADFFEFDTEVFNVNGCGENYIYRAYLVGLDFETGVGVYRIEPADPFNKCLPIIKKQKYLMFGSSKCYTPGNTVHTIADLRCSGSRSYSSGSVTDNTNLSRQGDVNYETITTNMDIGRGAEGAPILNDCGYVVGIITGMSANGNAIGVSSSFITRVIDAILDAACNVDDARNACCNDHALYVDLFGCVLYRYGTINWNFRGKTALDLNQLFLQRATSKTPCKVAPVAPAPGAHPFAVAADHNPCTDWEGLQSRFYNDATCRINRELLGIIIDCEPCGQLAEVVEECHRSSPNWGNGCSEIFQIEKGDVVTHLNGAPLGTLPNQNTPLNILYSLNACDCVELKFQKADELFTECHSLRVRLDDSLCWISEFRPIAMACLQISATDAADYLNTATNGPLEVTENIQKFVTNWLQFIFWLLHTVPQIYRATFFTNLSAFMVKLNALSNQTVYNSTDGGVPANNNTITLGTALQLSDLSRSVMSTVAHPSIASCYEPAAFIDFISSFQHPNNFECFKNSIPDYITMYAGSPTGTFARDVSGLVPEGTPSASLFGAVHTLPGVPKSVVDMASTAVLGINVFPTGTNQLP